MSNLEEIQPKDQEMSPKQPPAEAAAFHLAAIVESSDDAIISKDVNGIVTSWNAGAERIFGYAASEIVGRPISLIAAPETASDMPKILKRILMGERIEHYETIRRRKDGTVISISLSVSPIFDLAGNIIGASKIARDITEKKRAEEQYALLLNRERQSRKTAELLNQIGLTLAAELNVDKLAQAITDIATDLVDAELGAFFHNLTNEGGERHMLYTLSGVQREAFTRLSIPRAAELFGFMFGGKSVLRCGDITREPRAADISFYSVASQEQLPLRSYLAMPVISRSGEVLGGLLFGHSAIDMFTNEHERLVKGIAAQAAITIDNARSFENVQWAQAQLTRVNKDLETFAFSASHDLQEPIRAITISAQLLKRRSQLQDSEAVLLENILNSSSRVQTLLLDLIEFLKASKADHLLPSNVDPNLVLENVLAGLKGQIDAVNGLVTSEPLPSVKANQGQLANLFQNLITNALKYRSTKRPTVHISAVQQGEWAVFSVQDDGIGIEARYAEEIFEPFTRLHSQEEYAGSGIGLGLCRRIVEQYGGRIWLEKSTLREGSTFSFTVPKSAS